MEAAIEMLLEVPKQTQPTRKPCDPDQHQASAACQECT